MLDELEWPSLEACRDMLDMLDELEWPSLEACREQSFLTFLFKIHSYTVSLNKNRYLTPVTGSTQRRTSKINSTQYRMNKAYNDVLKNSFFPRTIPKWNSLASSVEDATTAEELMAKYDRLGVIK